MEKDYKLVNLSQNLPLPQYIFKMILELGNAISSVIDNRVDVVKRLGLDEKFCFGDANWLDYSGNDFVTASNYVRRCEYDIINVLRFWSQCFTGYKIMRLEGAAGTHSVESIPEDYDTWLLQNRSSSDGWCARWIALMQMAPKHVFSPPRMLGEIGWEIDGIVVSHDTYAYQERLSLLEFAGVFDFLQSLRRPPRILEIGGGYGALARAIFTYYPGSHYVICDLPESLMFSGFYLTATTGLTPSLFDIGLSPGESKSFVIVPNHLFDIFESIYGKFDLVINTLSMSEMSEHQVRRYARGISHLVGDEGLFFEQNQDNSSIGLINCKDHISEFFKFNKRLLPSHTLFHGAADLWSNRNLA